MTPNAWRREYRPLAIAHRGHSVECPENTREAYEQAIMLGAEMIECDVNMTRDGVLVMLHDARLERTTNGSGKVSDYTWEELQRLDAGGKFHARFAGARVPSAEATLRLFREAGLLGCFEVKGSDEAEAQRIAGALADLFVAQDALAQAFMSAYSHAALRFARTRVPELLIAPERLPDDAPPDPAEAVRQAQALSTPVLQHEHHVLSAEVVQALHGLDVAVWAWSTTSEQALVNALQLGADALMGDDVRTLLSVLNRERPRQTGT